MKRSNRPARPVRLSGLKLLPSVLAACFYATLAVVSARPGWAQELQYFRIGTGTTSGVYFPIGSALANAISNPPGSRPCDRGGSCGVPGLIAVAQATAGSLENLKLLREGAIEAGLVQADLAFWAHEGGGLFAKEAPFEDLRAIASLYTEAVQLVVRGDSDFLFVNSLRGKSISIGEKGSGFFDDARIILAAYGLKERAYQARFLAPGPAVDQLVAGGLDAMFVIGGTPFGAIKDAADRIPVRLLPFDDDVAATLREKLPYFTDTEIPAETYPRVGAVRTLGVGALLVVRTELADDVVYGITRALWHESTRKLLSAGLANGPKLHQIEQGRQGVSVPVHPGAERFYAEARAVVQAKEDEQAKAAKKQDSLRPTGILPMLLPLPAGPTDPISP
ncbi:MAG: TAXI family TRAP transporter solute-binding subunit [Azospirillum sp.]|nr:TAXI family TRAP transporter solute-binding subunit [Azospirillum sp.]